ncbi:phosphodiester glycosidase family protein [Verrucomicrobiaceae bacterium 227]
MDPEKSKPSLRFSDAEGEPLRDFSAFEKAAEESGETIIWMMNAGMYHKGGSPVGLCICDGKVVSPLNQNDGEGNFFLKPNGLFFLTEQGGEIIETVEWNARLISTTLCATQSGPLLVRRGKLHPEIRPNSPNKLIRNGVGVRSDGRLCFVISTNPVTFHEMALFCRDHLRCPNVLYLDGVVSALYAPKAGLTKRAEGLGPVFGLWE